MEHILGRYNGVTYAGRVATQLAQFHFFGEQEMAKHTASTLDATKMRRIKEIILAKFGAKQSAANKESIWENVRLLEDKYELS